MKRRAAARRVDRDRLAALVRCQRAGARLTALEVAQLRVLHDRCSRRTNRLVLAACAFAWAAYILYLIGVAK